MKTRNIIEIKVLDYLLGKSCLYTVHNIELLSKTLKFSLESMKEVLKGLEDEGIITFVSDNQVKLTDKTIEEIKDLSEIYKNVELIPGFDVELLHFGYAYLDITTPFRDSELDRVELLIEKKDGKLYIEVPLYKTYIFLSFPDITEEYVNQLKHRFNVDIDIEKHDYTQKLQIRKQTNPDSVIEDMYNILNVYLFLEGIVSKNRYKEPTKDELISVITGLVGQGVFSGYIHTELYARHNEEELEELVKQKEEELSKKLQDKSIDELWDILEIKAKEIIPVVDGKVDSHALSSFKRALSLLAGKGRFKIEYKGGRRIIGEWI